MQAGLATWSSAGNLGKQLRKRSEEEGRTERRNPLCCLGTKQIIEVLPSSLPPLNQFSVIHREVKLSTLDYLLGIQGEGYDISV